MWSVGNMWNTKCEDNQKNETESQTIEDFLQEALIMRQFDHPNVMWIYGVSLNKNKPCVILPLMFNGDLQKYLKDHDAVSDN